MSKGKKSPSGPKIVRTTSLNTPTTISVGWASFYALVDADLIYQRGEHLYEFRANNVVHCTKISDQTISTDLLNQFTLREIDEFINSEWKWHQHVLPLAQKNKRHSPGEMIVEFAREVLSKKHGTPDEIVDLLQHGFQSLDHVRMAKKNGDLNSKDFYAMLPMIGKKKGTLSWDAALKLKEKYGSSDLVECQAAKKGGFPSLDDMRQAKNLGFEKYNIWQDAINRGCSNKDEYDLLTEHGWPSLNDYHDARNQGFGEDEAELFDWKNRNNLGSFDAVGVSWLRAHDWAQDIIESQGSNGVNQPWSVWMYHFINTCGHHRINLMWLSKQINQENLPNQWRSNYGTFSTTADDLSNLFLKAPYNSIGQFTPHTMEYSISSGPTAVLDPSQTKKTTGMPTLPPPPDVDNID